MKKNFLLTLICACLPGAGQMYQGYMRRGLSLLLIFFGTFTLANLLYLDPLMLLMPVVWVYSFFDTFNLRNQTPEQRRPDDYMLHLANFGGAHWQTLLSKRNSIIGWGCIALAVVIGYNTLLVPMLYHLSELLNIGFLYTFARTMPSLVLAALLVWLGMHLLRGPKTAPTEYIAYQGEATDGK